jgi:hypothetical protein
MPAFSDKQLTDYMHSRLFSLTFYEWETNLAEMFD